MKQTFKRFSSTILRSLMLLTVLVTGSASAWGEVATLSFSKACGGSGTDSQGNTWTITSDATESTYDSNKGIHYGTGKAAVSYLTLTTSGITGTITKIVVNASGASQTAAVLDVTVGGAAFGSQANLTSTAKDYTFEGSATGEIAVKLSQSSATKALYVKSVAVTYSSDGGGGSTKTATTTTFPQTEYTAFIGEPFTSPVATVTGGTGLVPTYSSSKPEVATVNATTGVVTLVAAGKTDIKATFAGDDTYEESEASYTLTVVPVYGSLEALVAADITSGTTVKVSFENVAIKSFYTTSQGYVNGVYFNIQKDDKDIEIYYRNVPSEWAIEGTLSGTMICPWKKYSGTWELAPDVDSWNWTNLTYTAPAQQKTEATITATWKTTLSDSETDVYTVVYNGDGTLSVASSNTDVANASISGTTVTVTPVAAGTSTITISAPATALYTAAEKKYTLTVVEAFTPASLPFVFDGGKSGITPSKGMTQSGLGSDYSSSPKLKFDGSGDYLTIQFGEAAYLLSFVIKGNSFSDGTFKVQESADGENYSDIKVYSELGTTAQIETSPLKSESRFVKFLYSNKDAGNVAIGSIRISNEYQRIVTEGNLGTICLPKSVPSGVYYGATFYSVSGVTKSGTAISGVVLTEETGKLEAGKPYVFKATGSSLAVAYEGESVSNAVSATGLVGNLSSTPVDVPQGAYILSQNKLCKLAGGNATVAQNRAYFDLSNVAEVSAASSSYVIIDVEEEGSANGLEAISATKSQEMYDITGRRVNVATKGMFIIDGKKVIVK